MDKFETNSIRTQIDLTQEKEHSTPLYMTSSFQFENAEEMGEAFAGEIEANIYSRFVNPNTTEFVQKMCLLEGAEAGHATASGMAAVFATFAGLLKQGDHILSCRSIFGSTHGVLNKILPKFGITSSYVDYNEVEQWESAIQENTKLIYVETPTNPALDLVDLEKVGELAKKHQLIFVVDNCFATPYLQQPLKFGANLSLHSATKFIDGQGRAIGGVVVGDKHLVDEIFTFCRSTGPSLSPFNAWLFSKSLETLAVRMDRHCDNALVIAKQLSSNSEIENLKYPFLPSHPQFAIAKKQMSKGGALISFEVKGGVERGARFLNHLKLASLTANLGDTRTIVSHPSSTTHAKLTEEERLEVGIAPGLIRVSVGLESLEDIIADLEQAIEKSRAC